MRITIAVHGHLRHTSGVGQDELTFTLPDAGGLRIRDILESINVFEEEVKEVLVNGRKARMDSTLHGHAKLDFFPKGR